MSGPPRSFSISAISRGFARLLAMGALAGAWVLLLLASLSVPTRSFTISTTNFKDGGSLSLGIFGSCYQPVKGDKQCTTAKVGFNVDIAGLPNYGVNPGGGLNVTSSSLTGSLIFFPLATGATAFTNLLSLIPARSVTMMALGMTFLSIGATAISFVVALVVAVRASAVIQLSFTPSFAVPIIGTCVWFACAALLAECGAFILLLIALPPTNDSPRYSSKGENIYAARYDDNSPHHSDRKSLAQAPRARRVDEDMESNSGRTRIARRLTPLSHASKYRSDDEESVLRKPEDAKKASSQRSHRTVFEDAEEDEDTPPEVEKKSEVKSRKRRSKSHQSIKERREADQEEEDDGYIDFEVDFAGRRV